MGDSKLSPMDKTEGPFRLIKHAMISGRYDTVIAGLVPTLMDAMPSPEEEWWTRGTTIRKKKLVSSSWTQQRFRWRATLYFVVGLHLG